MFLDHAAALHAEPELNSIEQPVDGHERFSLREIIERVQFFVKSIFIVSHR